MREAYLGGRRAAMQKLGVLIPDTAMGEISNRVIGDVFPEGLRDRELYKGIKDLAKQEGVPTIRTLPWGSLLGPMYVGSPDLGFEFIHMPLYGQESRYLPHSLLSAADVYAHELGHAKIERNPILKYTQKPWTRMKAHYGNHAGLGAGLLAGALAGQDADGGGAADAAGIAATLAPSAPMMASEGIASLKGDKMLRDLGANSEQMWKARKRLGKAYATYGLIPAAALAHYGLGRLAGYGPSKLINYLTGDEESETPDE